MAQNLIIFEPVLNYLENHIGFLSINFLQGLGEEILDFRYLVTFFNSEPLTGKQIWEVLAENLKDLNLLI